MYYDFYFSTLHRSLFVNPSNRNRSYPECIGIRCRPKASSDTRNTSAMGPCLATGTGFNVCFVKKSYPVTNRLGFFRTFQGHMNQQIYINLLVKKLVVLVELKELMYLAKKFFISYRLPFQNRLNDFAYRKNQLVTLVKTCFIKVHEFAY